MVRLKQLIPKKKIPLPGASGPSKPPTPKRPDAKAGEAPSLGGGIARPTLAPMPGPRLPPDVTQRVIDKGRDVGANGPSTISLADKHAMEKLLATPTAEGLRWLVDPEAQRVLKLMTRIPGILDTLLGSGKSPREVFDFVLADGIGLSDEDLDEVLRHGRRLLGGPPSFLGLPAGRFGLAQTEDGDVYVQTTDDTTAFASHDCTLPMAVGREVEGCDGPGQATMIPKGTQLQVLARSLFNPLVVLVTDGEGEYWVYALDGVRPVSGDVRNIPIDSEQIPDPSLNPWTRAEAERRSTTYPLDVEDPSTTAVMRFGVIQPQYSGVWAEGRHPGMDFFAPAGTRVGSLTDGEVVGVFTPSMFESLYELSPYKPDLGRDLGFARMLGFDPRTDADSLPAMDRVGGLMGQGESVHGAFVVVRTGNAFVVYAHLDPSSIQVGQYVQEGQIIGEVGTYDEMDPDNDHTHIELRTAGSGNPRNDRPLFALNPELLFQEDFLDSFLHTALETSPYNDTFDETILGMQAAPNHIHRIGDTDLDQLWLKGGEPQEVQ